MPSLYGQGLIYHGPLKIGPEVQNQAALASVLMRVEFQGSLPGVDKVCQEMLRRLHSESVDMYDNPLGDSRIPNKGPVREHLLNLCQGKHKQK